MKRYYVDYGTEVYSNRYTLYWADGPKMTDALPATAERITRKLALQLCRAELERRRYNPSGAWYASSCVYPAGLYGDPEDLSGWQLRGYIWERD